MQQGLFYALPQSPQIFKQILMISGFDKYFQIVRCFRDEDLRADRQYEFTQIDLEMSFPQQETIFGVIEPLIQRVCEVSGHPVPQRPFLHLTYNEAMRKYGIDKPDLRLPPMTPFEFDFPGFSTGMPFVAIRIPEAREAQPERTRRVESVRSRAQLDPVRRRREDRGNVQARGPLRRGCRGGRSHSRRWRIRVPSAHGVRKRRSFRIAGNSVCTSGRSSPTGTICSIRKDFRFLWVVDFPMFEWDEEENRWNAAHHPFTSVYDEDLEKLTTDPAALPRQSLRPGVERDGTRLGLHSNPSPRHPGEGFRGARVLATRKPQRKFGFLLEALEYGAPPHGGIALGLDRLVMIMAGENSIREVIPFPKTAKGTDLMSDAPSPVPDRSLKELGIRVVAGPKS